MACAQHHHRFSLAGAAQIGRRLGGRGNRHAKGVHRGEHRRTATDRTKLFQQIATGQSCRQ
jgi:hypothetical protein